MTSIAEKVMTQEASDGEIGHHHKIKINMEAEIEKILRPMRTYLLMTYALRNRITTQQTYEKFKGVLILDDQPKPEYKDVYHFIIFNNDEEPGCTDIAHFYFHFDTERDTIYVTSGTVATQILSTEDVVNVLKATIGVDD